jgi:hypothetical protein
MSKPTDNGETALGPLGLPLSHFCYLVDDIDTAVDLWTSKMKAGPFFTRGRVVADEAAADGEPAVFDYSSAFGQWGSIPVELLQIHDVRPLSLSEKLVTGPVHHVAYISPEPEGDSRRLAAAGMPLILDAVIGPLHARFHDCPALGHTIELHRSSERLTRLFDEVEKAAVGWDGSDPLRVLGQAPKRDDVKLSSGRTGES